MVDGLMDFSLHPLFPSYLITQFHQELGLEVWGLAGAWNSALSQGGTQNCGKVVIQIPKFYERVE